ncbi:hypothetical protein [Plantibacter cousiniae (nom. nud.)]|uniref:Homeodomain-like domain-containing protein n=1 Tax=Plantibacter cousiniae (nom. nud.) TaxID=199709 RepID=A0ABY1LJP9_9MICO|nr:hypothetical protein [Plantibacter cousiniae]SKC50441.1 hypothetical protein SAMN06295973_1477 [Plantibacter cousiniae]
MSRKQRADASERASRAWQLRVSGSTWQEIADQLGYVSPSNVYRACMNYFGTVPQPDKSFRIEMWRQRIEALWGPALRDVQKGRAGAIRAATTVAQRAAALDGLDAPTRVSVTSDAEIDAWIDDYARLKRLAGELPAEVEEGDIFAEVVEDEPVGIEASRVDA